MSSHWVVGLDILDGLHQRTLTSPGKLIGVILKQKLQSQIRRNLEGVLRLPIATWGKEGNYLDQEAEGMWVRSKLQGFGKNICMGSCLTKGAGGMMPIKVKVLRTKRVN